MAIGAGIRERRRAGTTAALIAAARRRVIAAGLSGFTIEDLCADVDISRRTFFNYFATKENAVVGIPVRFGDQELVEAFIAAGERSGEVSPTLIDDFAELVIGRWEKLNFTSSDIAELREAFAREPRLLDYLAEIGAAGEKADARSIEIREGLAEGDLRATVAVEIVTGLKLSASRQLFAEDATDDLRTLVLNRVRVARGLFAVEN